MIPEYTLVKRMAGSLMLISKGLMSASLATLAKLISFWFSSDWLTYLLSPVSFLSRFARRNKILPSRVSGIMAKNTKKTGPESHNISHNDHRQFSAATAKPDSKGPRAGAQKAADTQNAMAIGTYSILHMSCIVAPPVAKHGLPKNPCKNRSTSKPPKLSTKAVGSDSITNMANVAT